MKALLLAMALASGLNFFAPRVVIADVRWVEKEKQHKRDVDLSGGEERWRDHFYLDGYVLYDFTIHIISVRGGSKWWGSEMTRSTITALGAYWGVDSRAFANRMAKEMQGGASTRPWPDISGGGESIRIYGYTRWQTYGGNGGNVKYRIAACFISKSDLQRLPQREGRRFSVMGIRGSREPFERDKILIAENIASVLSNSGSSSGGAELTPIARKYLSLGGPQGFLGPPADGAPGTNERITPDRIGRFVRFQNGSIYWSPNTGAFEVHGAIREKWSATKWEAGFLGYPVTDEMPTPDRIGRFNHFQGGSIYWTPQTGAHEVHGAIRDKWASLGWERSFLGYPTTDELNTQDGRGKISQFQGGHINWYPDRGASEHRSIVPKGGDYLTVHNLTGRTYEFTVSVKMEDHQFMGVTLPESFKIENGKQATWFVPNSDKGNFVGQFSDQSYMIGVTALDESGAGRQWGDPEKAGGFGEPYKNLEKKFLERDGKRFRYFVLIVR